MSCYPLAVDEQVHCIPNLASQAKWHLYPIKHNLAFLYAKYVIFISR